MLRCIVSVRRSSWKSMGDCPDRRQWCWLGRLLRSHALQRRSCLDQGVPSPMKCSVDSSPPAERASRIKTLPCRLGGNSRSLCWLKVLCSKPGSFSSISKKPAKQEVGGQPLANQPAAPSQYGAINNSLFGGRSGGIDGRPTTLYIAAKVGESSRSTCLATIRRRG